MPEVNRLCPDRGKPLVIRTNRANGSEFLGCSGYAPDSPAHRGYTEALPEWYRLMRSGTPMLPGMEP